MKMCLSSGMKKMFDAGKTGSQKTVLLLAADSAQKGL